jgi:hypothetical protein
MKNLEIFKSPKQLAIAVLVIGGMLGFVAYGIVTNVIPN